MKLDARFIIVILVPLICLAPISTIVSVSQGPSEEVTLESVMVDGETQNYLLYSPVNPIGAVLIIPSFMADHYEYFTNRQIEGRDPMEEAPIVKAAIAFNLALVFAQGAKRDYYSPTNGEKKVLACLNDANATLNIPSESWFIFGFSMGGGGAITIPLRHPDLFAGIYVGDGLLWNAELTQKSLYDLNSTLWDPPGDFFQLNPLNHLEFFRNKTLFLASGTNAGTMQDTLVQAVDAFSRALNSSSIQHYYYRGQDGHSIALVHNSVNLAFNMFSHHIVGTLDQFYANPWPETTTTTTQPTTTTTTANPTPAWMMTVLLIALVTLLIRRKID